MKIAIGMKIQDKAFGGGNQFGKYLSTYLIQSGHQVCFDLCEPDIDIVLMTDPRSHLSSVSFGAIEIMRYVSGVNSKAILIQRINECDERKGTMFVNKQLSLANSIMDHTVYVATWLVDLFKKQGLVFTQNFSIIKNGADPSVFTYEQKKIDETRKIKLVTHHWSSNKMKGWDVYSTIDKMLDEQTFSSRFEFHYIGNAPKDIFIRNIIVHKPSVGVELATLLKQCDIYISASINEPAGMHHIEGALCGLPILYRNSGALPEYCEGFGVEFNGPNDIYLAIDRLVKDYDVYVNRLKEYKNTSDVMCASYLNLFERLIKNRDEILQKRVKNKFGLIQKYKMFFFSLFEM